LSVGDVVSECRLNHGPIRIRIRIVMGIWFEARSSRKQNSLCEGFLEGNMISSGLTWLFCSGDDDYLGFDNTGGKGKAVPLEAQRVP